MICINYSCDRELTSYELARLITRFNKYRLCIKCRLQPWRVVAITCQKCGKSANNTGLTGKLFCSDCIKLKHAESRRDYQRRRRQK